MGTVPAFASLGEAMDMARDALSCLAAADAIQLATKTQAECLWGLAAGQSSESAARTICLWTERLPEKSQEESDELLVTAAANRAARAVAAATGGRAVKITQAYRFALDPSPAQERMLWSHAGAARFAWNWGLAKCQERYETEGKWYSAAELHKLWNVEKKASPSLAWWRENSKYAYQEAFRNLDRALADFIKSKKGERKGRRLGFPKFKKRGRCRDSFRFGTGGMRCVASMVTLPRLGTIRTHESTRKLARRLEAGTARILSATVSRTAQRWHVSFTVQVERAVPDRHARPGSAVGVDLGIRALLTGVDDEGQVVTATGPKAFRASLRRLRRASRAHSRKQLGSANCRKHAARLARIHARVAYVRADALHKATTSLAARYETVVVEDLNVTGMLANRKLARAVADQGFGSARRMLGYKTTRNGGHLLVANRWYPSSKNCSACGWRKPSLTLAERTFICEACGLVIDRDINAARNLLDLAASGAERLNASGAQVRPGMTGHRVTKQEPGAAHADETGTASWQRLAAGRELTQAHESATVTELQQPIDKTGGRGDVISTGDRDPS